MGMNNLGRGRIHGRRQTFRAEWKGAEVPASLTREQLKESLIRVLDYVSAFALSCLDGPSSFDDGHRNNADKETPGDCLGPTMRLEDNLKICGGPTSIERDAWGPDLNGFAQVVREDRQTLEAANPPEVVGAMAYRGT